MGGQGYADPAYARTLGGFGEPVHLPNSGGSVLVRPIGGSGRQDATGCYPLFACPDWAALPNDLDWLAGQGLVTFTCVADPFAPMTGSPLPEAFDLARPFKTHFLTELVSPPHAVVSRHHRYYARRALRRLTVEVADSPADHLDEWCTLYGHSVAAKGMQGIRAFSRAAFQCLLGMEGVLLFRAIAGGKAVAAQTVCLDGAVAYVHLLGMTPAGYEAGASYALDWTVLETLHGRCRWVHWGGVSGLEDDPHGGLAWFKKGWSTHRRYAWLLGRALDRRTYRALGCRLPVDPAAYFPCYRSGEHG